MPVTTPEKTAWLTTTALGVVTLGSAGVAGGGGIRVSYDGTSGFGWEADMLAHRTSDQVALGEVTIGAVGASVSVHWHHRLDSIYVRTAVGGRLSTVTMTGTPDDPEAAVGDRLEGIAGGPLGRLTLGARLVSDLTIELSAEPGFNVFPIRGTVDGEKETAVDGAWLTGQLAVGWAW